MTTLAVETSRAQALLCCLAEALAKHHGLEGRAFEIGEWPVRTEGDVIYLLTQLDLALREIRRHLRGLGSLPGWGAVLAADARACVETIACLEAVFDARVPHDVQRMVLDSARSHAALACRALDASAQAVRNLSA